MTQDVIVSISGLQFSTDQPQAAPDPIELVTVASYYYRNGKHYILFEENDPDLQRRINNRIKFNGEFLEYTRSGAVNTKMLFEMNRSSVGYYKTPFGHFSVGIHANDINLSEKPDHIHFSMDYSLDFNQQACAQCSIVLDIATREAFSMSL